MAPALTSENEGDVPVRSRAGAIAGDLAGEDYAESLARSGDDLLEGDRGRTTGGGRKC